MAHDIDDITGDAFWAAAELEFRVTNEDCFLILESGRHSCTFVLEERIEQSNGTTLEFVSSSDVLASDVLADASENPSIVDAAIADETAQSCLFRFVVLGRPLVATVGDSGAILKHFSATNGVGRIVISAPPLSDLNQIVDRFRSRHPNSTLVGRREHDVGPLFDVSAPRVTITRELTDMQRECLTVAYENGYFERPQRTTARECARLIGIAQSAFDRHVHDGLQKILGTLIGGASRR